MKYRTLLLGLALILATAVLFTSCGEQSQSGGESDAGTAEADSEEKIWEDIAALIPISNPDEAYALLQQETDPDTWGDHADESVEINTDDSESAAFSIGVRGTNAILLTALGDSETAEAIAQSISRAAGSLAIQTDRIDSLVQQLTELLESDAEASDRQARIVLNSIADELAEALLQTGDEEAALALQLGIWVESLRQSAGIVVDDYSALASTVFRRRSEAAVFGREYLTLASENDEYASLAESLLALSTAMESDANRTIPQAQIERIYDITTGIKNEML